MAGCDYGILVRSDEAPRATLVSGGSGAGTQSVVFRHAYLGGPANLWLAPLDRAGEDARDLAVVVSGRSLEWRGRQGPTLTLDGPADEAFLSRAGYDGIAHISIGRHEPGAHLGGWKVDARPGERIYDLTLHRGGLNAIGYLVTVKRGRDGRWRARDLRVAWIS